MADDSSTTDGTTTPSFEAIQYQADDPIATITLNRPDRLNALTRQMLEELSRAISLAEHDKRVVGMVLTGAGRGFCAGADMQMLQSISDGAEPGTPSQAGGSAPERPGDPDLGADFVRSYTYLLAVRKPIIAAVNGPCAGLGFAIALLCDLRFASGTAVFTSAFANRGLIAEHGTSWILPRLVGPAHALDILWSGRRLSAEEAERIGLINRLVAEGNVADAARDYIRSLAQTSSPTSLKIIKRQVYKHLMCSLGPAMEESDQLMHESVKRPDFKEGVASYVEKRKPAFERVGV